MISSLGYTPDVFFGPISGRILGANPGAVGFQNYFAFLASIAVFGLLVVAWLVRLQRHANKDFWRQIPRNVKY